MSSKPNSSSSRLFVPDELTRRAEYYGGLFKTSLECRPQVAIDFYNLLYHLDLFDVLLTEEYGDRPKTLRITALEVSLIFHEWLGFVVDHCIGSYYAAARTLRWIYESSLGSAVALIDGRLLLGPSGRRHLTLNQFENWLRQYDAHSVTFPRRRSLGAIGLSLTQQQSCNDLYSSLCKFSHLSTKSFVPVSSIAEMVVDVKHFDVIANYAYRAMDLALYCIIKATVSQWDISDFLASYLPYFRTGEPYVVRRRKFPLTLSLL
jgi:hypothetical protein